MTYEKSSLAKGFRSLHINRKPLATKYVYKNTYTNENIAYLYGANKNTNKKRRRKKYKTTPKQDIINPAIPLMHAYCFIEITYI